MGPYPKLGFRAIENWLRKVRSALFRWCSKYRTSAIPASIGSQNEKRAIGAGETKEMVEIICPDCGRFEHTAG